MATIASQNTSGNAPPVKAKASVTKRLQTELMTLMMSGNKACTAFPDGDNLFSWTGNLLGADGTVYEGLSYKLSLKFPAEYPFVAPTIKFVTPCFHPNVDTHGNICLDILKEKWSAAYSVETILVSLRSLLGEPNNDSPLNSYAAQLWDNQAEYLAVNKQKYKEAQANANA
jgi:ubiquitin-conjugating enzyme E2 C